jgi:hypothetical protein
MHIVPTHPETRVTARIRLRDSERNQKYGTRKSDRRILKPPGYYTAISTSSNSKKQQNKTITIMVHE